MYPKTTTLVAQIAFWATLGLGAHKHPKAAFSQNICSLPTTDDGNFETVTPAEVGLTSAQVNEDLAYANLHGRDSVQVFRNNCLIGRRLADSVTDSLPAQVWSVTKSVVEILAGMAVADGKLDIDRPIGDYLPDKPGWGDNAHRAITVRDILTETSGTQEALFAEDETVLTDPSVIQELLAQKVIHPPGMHFEYGQRDVDAAAYIVQSAAGCNLQEYAQECLFGLLGIKKSSCFWLRD